MSVLGGRPTFCLDDWQSNWQSKLNGLLCTYLPLEKDCTSCSGLSTARHSMMAGKQCSMAEAEGCSVCGS